MRELSIICTLGLLLSPGEALADPDPATRPKLSPAIALVAEKMRAIKTLQVELREEKELKVLAEKVQARGTLVFARPRRLAIDLQGEGGTTLVIDGNTMPTVYKALKRTERVDLAKDPRARAVAEHLFLLLEAEPEALAAIYDLAVLEEKPLTMVLTPRPEALAKILRKVEARFDERGFVDRLALFEQNGDVTRWNFSAPHINEPVSESAFEVAPMRPREMP